ncbi:site-specific integrase [Burkholderia gladioli]|uniref:site-specific integrase n=1 Tax=Burkholderia gladioli TaxID=28095 RepID=UPI001FC8296C|nr:site-specific integrase [Burkholderia gladioli]
MEALLNPLDNIRKPTGSRERDRRRRSGQFEKLRELLTTCGNRWAAPAFELAIETSLRQGALFSIRWEWLDIEKRLIKFPPDARGADNKGVPAALPLSSRAIDVLRHLGAIAEDAEARLARSLYGPANVNFEGLKGRVFGTTANAVMCVWKRVIKSASAEDPEVKSLRWHDLRHEAASRFFEKGLHPMEVASITGHRSMQMLKRYTHLHPESLLAELG